MKCDNDHCIYNHKNRCILNEISLDYMGLCESCIMARFNDDALVKEKNRILNEIRKNT